MDCHKKHFGKEANGEGSGVGQLRWHEHGRLAAHKAMVSPIRKTSTRENVASLPGRLK
jgi:hypothetical protein